MELLTQESSQQQLKNIWKHRLLMLSIALIILCLLFYGTVESMIQIWSRSETFTHGFLIFPISLYLVWQNKKQLSMIEPVSQLIALPLMVIVTFGWLMSSLVDVLIVQQWAFVTLILLMVLLVLGWSVVKQILFPLLYLYFMVPFGEQFISPMMHMTAKFVISTIELTGIPIYSEGTFFTLPSGSWSVVEGCSGVRYLIASIALGTLYAYMTYSSYLKRSLFILASIIFPIIANWVRAFLIVMLGHFSGMKLATGVDHIIYGWVFFGFVLFIMFWVGAYWRDDEDDKSSVTIPTLIQEKNRRLMLLLFSGILLLSIGPIIDYRIKQDALLAVDEVNEINILASQPWKRSQSNSIQWTPRYIKPTRYFQAEYKSQASSQIGLYIAYYAVQQQGSELINSQNIMIPQKHALWSQLRESSYQLRMNDQSETVLETHLHSDQNDILIWHWNVINKYVVSNSYKAKLIEAIEKISGGERSGYAVVVYTRFEKDNIEDGRKQLQTFINDMLATITQSMDGLQVKSD